MTRLLPPCTRSWEAEAATDERLSGAARASFERHVATCRACAAEVRRLARLREAVARLPNGETTPLEHRRQRASLLRRANDQLVGGRLTSSPPRRRLIVAFAILGVAVAGIALASWSSYPPRTQPSVTRPAETASAHESVPSLRITTLEDAQCAQDASTLDANEFTESAPPPVAVTRPARAPAAPPVSASPPAADVSNASADLGAALTAFSAGDYGRAETLFTAFEANHPDDARVEDAAFSIAVARARRGDVSGARAAARDYLIRYPTGFRRQEATRLAAD